MTNKLLRRLAPLCLFLALAVGRVSTALAQGPTANEPIMADALRASGKIYVVVAAVVVIVVGMLLYLVSLDRKVGRLEKRTADLTDFNG